MRSPRISIAEIMVIVAIVAVDCLAIRGVPDLVLLSSCLRRIADAVAPGDRSVDLVFGRRRRGDKPLTFLIVFEFVGWVSLLVYVAVCFQSPRIP